MEPQHLTATPYGELALPRFYPQVLRLADVVPVDYQIPGCPPRAAQVWEVLEAVIAGEVPLATVPARAWAATTGRSATSATARSARSASRSSSGRTSGVPEPNWCLLEQGFVCLGPATRSGCGALCTKAGLTCRGCYGASGDAGDQGTAMLSALGSIIDATTEDRARELVDRIADPAGTFYRFSLASSRSRAGEERGADDDDHARRPPGYRRISIDPITRLEGHGKIDIFLDDQGDVAECFFQVPELRGFEKFCEGRPVEEMPRITPRICGVCPEAHMMASAKACDAVYKVSLPLTARLIRELQYNLFYVTDHATHFYALAAPDFVHRARVATPPNATLIGVIRKLGVGVGQEVIKARKWGHEAAAIFGGRPVNPENAIPGGVCKPISRRRARPPRGDRALHGGVRASSR